MANDGRAWQRSLKNGKTEAYASIDGESVRVIGDTEIVWQILNTFSHATGADISLNTVPEVIEGQTDIFEVLGQ